VISKTLRFTALGFLASLSLMSASHAYVVDNLMGSNQGYTVTYQHVTETPEPPGYGAVQNVGVTPYAASPVVQPMSAAAQSPIQPGALVAQAQNGSQLQPLPKASPKKKSAKKASTQTAPRKPRPVAADPNQPYYNTQSGPIMQGGYNQPAQPRYYANQYQRPIAAPNYYQGYSYNNWGSSPQGCVGGS
jgi:hypothetical protein